MFKFNPFTGTFDLIRKAEMPGILDGKVTDFASLPLASDNAGKFYVVENTTGVIFVNRRKAGIYVSNGTDWTYLTSFVAEQIPFQPTADITATDVQAAIEEVRNIVANPIKCEHHVINLVANTPFIVPHTLSKICSYMAHDSLGEEIGLSYNYNPGTAQLQVCSTGSINNILITIEGEI